MFVEASTRTFLPQSSVFFFERRFLSVTSFFARRIKKKFQEHSAQRVNIETRVMLLIIPHQIEIFPSMLSSSRNIKLSSVYNYFIKDYSNWIWTNEACHSEDHSFTIFGESCYRITNKELCQ